MADRSFKSANITVNFSINTADCYCTVELDDREEKNGSKTTFGFGDTVHFRVYHNATGSNIIASAGTISKSALTGADEDELVEDEMLTFTLPDLTQFSWYKKKKTDNTANLSKEAAVSPAPTFKFAGQVQAVTVDDDDRTLVTASDFGCGVVWANYTTKFEELSLVGPSESDLPSGWDLSIDYPVVVVITAW